MNKMFTILTLIFLSGCIPNQNDKNNESVKDSIFIEKK